MADPKTDAFATMSGAAAHAICIAQTLHERDAKFLEALKTNVEEFQRFFSELGDADTSKLLYAFGISLENHELFPRH